MTTQLKGLSFPIRLSPLGHLTRAEGIDKYKQNMYAIAVQEIGERVMNPTFGVHGLSRVFRNLDIPGIALTEDVLREAITKFEPRVRVLKMESVAEDTQGRLRTTLNFQVKSTGQHISFPIITEA